MTFFCYLLVAGLVVFVFLAETLASYLKRRQKKIFAKCGHEITNSKGAMNAFGETVEAEFVEFNSNTPYCYRCLEKMAIRCVCCGKVIFIGSKISFLEKSRATNIPTYAVSYEDDPRYLIKCTRSECDSMEYFWEVVGSWEVPGRVFLVPYEVEENGNRIVTFKYDGTYTKRSK